MERKLDEYKEAERRLKERQEARIRKGQTLESKAVVDLKTAKERISELEAEIANLEEQLEDMICLRDGAEIRANGTQRELDNAIENLEIRNKELEAETQAKRELEKEKIDWETEKKNKKEKIANLKEKIKDLEKELKKHEPSMLYQVADKLGIIQLKNSISNVLIIAGAVVVLYAIS